MLLLASSVCGLFKWRQFEPEVILLAVGWYLRFSLSYRDVQELLAERSLRADHVTVWRWVQRYAPEIQRRLRPRLRPTNDSWRVDETYIGVKASGSIYTGLSTPPVRRSIFFCRLNATQQRLSASSPKPWEVRTIRTLGSSTPTSMPVIRRRLCNSKTKVPWRRTANFDRCSTSTTSWSRITGPSNAGSAQANIFVHSGELGVRSPATKRSI
jgi:hypothetical protein